MKGLEFLDDSAELAAQRLLGCIIERTYDNTMLKARIVETEAYDQTDAASHSYNGRTPRTDVMFGPSGLLYVYFTYGMHYCMNIVTSSNGIGSAVLIRAIEPLAGSETMSSNRHGRNGIELTNGPAKLCQALSVDSNMNGHRLNQTPMRLLAMPPLTANSIVTTTRVGISKAKDELRRYYERYNPYVSRI